MSEIDVMTLKTNDALQDALLRLLKHRNFKRITVNGLCEEALVTRPTFYAQFKNKYELLEFWLINIGKKINEKIGVETDYIQIESVNRFLGEKINVITNLLADADNQTLKLLYKFMVSLLDIQEERKKDGKLSRKHIVFSNFWAGGMVNLLSWQVENKFPEDLQMINPDFISLLMHLMKWYSDTN